MYKNVSEYFLGVVFDNRREKCTKMYLSTSCGLFLITEERTVQNVF